MSRAHWRLISSSVRCSVFVFDGSACGRLVSGDVLFLDVVVDAEVADFWSLARLLLPLLGTGCLGLEVDGAVGRRVFEGKSVTRAARRIVGSNAVVKR